MKGHIRERSPGRWAIVIDVHDSATGKRKRKWHSFDGTKREAQVECARLVAELHGGTYVDPTKLSVAEFLDRWLDAVKANVSPRTHERYSEIIHKNVVPLIGAVRLRKLEPLMISEAYRKALANGRRKRSGGLSPRTVHHMHRLLKQALRQAVRWRVLVYNPADAVDPPKVETAKMTTYTIDQTAELLEAFRPTRMFIPVLLAVLCGMRRGELAALRWRHVDLAGNAVRQISVVETAEQTKAGVRYKPPKSNRSRTIAMSGTVVEELRAHRLRQAEELLRAGIRLGDDDFVVAQADGAPLQPRSITHEWVRLLGKTALPRIRFHDLRHAHATHMLSAGVHPKVASERLGHSKVGITLDLYSHVMPGMQEAAASRVDDALQAAIQRRQKEIG